MIAKVGKVAQTSSSASGQTLTATAAAAIPAGRLLLFNYASYLSGGNGGQPTMSDNSGLGNSYDNGTNIPAWSASGYLLVGQDFLFTTVAIPSGTVFTVDFGISVGGRYLDIYQYAGLASDPGLIRGNAGNAFSGTALTSNTTPAPTGGQQAYIAWGVAAYMPYTATFTSSSSPTIVSNFSAAVGTLMRVVTGDVIVKSTTGGFQFKGTTSAAMTEGLALYDCQPQGPEQFHDQDFYQRRSGLVVPTRRAVFRRAS